MVIVMMMDDNSDDDREDDSNVDIDESDVEDGVIDENE